MERQVFLKNTSRIQDIEIDLRKISFFLLCCYVALSSLVYIDFIPTVMISMALYAFVLVSMLTVILSKKISINIHVASYGVFMLWCFISSVYSGYFNASFATSIEVLKIFVFVFMLVNIVDSVRQIEIIMSVYSICPVFLIIYMALTNQLFVDERLGGDLTGNANTFATLLMVASMSSVYLIFNSKGTVGKIIAYICFFIEEFALALTGSRKAAIFPIILFCAIIVIKADRKGRKHIIRNVIIATLIIVGIFTAIMEVPFFYDAIGYRMEGLLNLFSGEGEVDSSSLVRTDMMNEAIARWKEKPIFGHGIDTYKKLSHYGCYSHNNFAELLCDIGIVGFIIYYFFYANMLVKMLAQKKFDLKKWYWIFFLIFICVSEYGTITYYMFPIQTFFTLMCIFSQSYDEKD